MSRDDWDGALRGHVVAAMESSAVPGEITAEHCKTE